MYVYVLDSQEGQKKKKFKKKRKSKKQWVK